MELLHSLHRLNTGSLTWFNRKYRKNLPSGSVWSGKPFLVEWVSTGKATESAEQRASLSFFFASLKNESKVH